MTVRVGGPISNGAKKVPLAPRGGKHLISNIRVTQYDASTVTAANYIVLETLIDEPTRILQACTCHDLFAMESEELLIKERRCVYDTVLVSN